MTQTPQTSQPASSKPAEITRDAALIATFYVPRETAQPLMKPLVDHLVTGLELEQCNPGDRYLGSWRNLATQTFLNTFITPASHDTTVIQLVQNTQEQAAHAWVRMSKNLENHLDNHLLQPIWGYTLVYQAMLVQDVAPDQAMNHLQVAARPLYAARSRQLAQACLSGGKLWLLKIPLEEDGIQASMVYAALSQYDPKDDCMVLDVLYGPGAALLMPDLIAHKCYNLMRQYQSGSLIPTYEQLIDTLLATTNQLLDNVQRGVSTESDLQNLTREHNQLDGVVYSLDELRVSLTALLRSYNWWRERSGCGDVAEFHHSHIETAHLDMEILVGKGQNALEKTSMNIQTIGTAMQIVQVNLDKEEKKRDQIVQMLLAVVGAALAVPEYVDPGALFNVENAAAQLLIQIVITAIFAVVIWFMIRMINATGRD